MSWHKLTVDVELSQLNFLKSNLNNSQIIMDI